MSFHLLAYQALISNELMQQIRCFCQSTSVLYVLWLNFKTFSSVSKIRQTFETGNNEVGYQCLVRYSKLSLLTSQKMITQNDATDSSVSLSNKSVEHSNDSSLAFSRDHHNDSLNLTNPSACAPLITGTDQSMKSQQGEKLISIKFKNKIIFKSALQPEMNQGVVKGQEELLSTIPGCQLFKDVIETRVQIVDDDKEST